MKLDHFNHRTPHLRMPKDIHEMYYQVVKECETCPRLTDAPPRSKVSGLRSEVLATSFLPKTGTNGTPEVSLTKFLPTRPGCL